MKQPIIIIGMHRSGTTMITNMLQKLGLYLGWVLQENAEALFFVERNEKLLNVCGGDWEHPEVIENLLSHRAMREQAAAKLRRDMESGAFLSYLGPERRALRGRLDKLTFPWGWKDPRNSFTLPLWLDLFPEARVVHIYRHPMDVALSLQTRETRGVENRLTRLRGQPSAEVLAAKTADLREEKGLLYLYRRWRAAQSRFGALRAYDRLRVAETVNPRKGLELWIAHVGKCLEHTDARPAQSLNLKYEDFLDKPAENLEALRAFCGLQGTPEEIRALCGRVRADRRLAYRADPAASALFEQHRAHPLIRRLGYDAV